MKTLVKTVMSKILFMSVLPELKKVEIMDHKGNFVRPFDLSCESIDLEVIALGLSRVKRFFGQTRLSVAQHSVMLAEYFMSIGRPDLAKQAILHDASEAFMGDLITPIKRMILIFKMLEEVITERVFVCHGLPYPMSAEIHEADSKIMVSEATTLMPNPEYWESFGPKLPGANIEVWSEEQSFKRFMAVIQLLGMSCRKAA